MVERRRGIIFEEIHHLRYHGLIELRMNRLDDGLTGCPVPATRIRKKEGYMGFVSRKVGHGVPLKEQPSPAC
jgi:hypothetical protein